MFSLLFSRECVQRPLQRRSLFRVRRFGEETLIGRDREIECRGIVFGAGETRGIVGKRCSRQLVLRKLSRDREPTINAQSQVGLRQRPEMPRATIPRVGFLRTPRERTNDLGAASGEPIRVREDDHRLRILRAYGNNVFVRRNHDLGHVLIRLGGLRQLLRVGVFREHTHAIE